MLKNKRYGMFLLAVLLSVCCAVLPAAAEPVSYDIAGRWMIEGEGYDCSVQRFRPHSPRPALRASAWRRANRSA